MDDPALDPKILDAAVADINKVNRLLGGFHFTLGAVKKELQRMQQPEITIVDAGCGDGAILRYLATRITDPRVVFLGLDFSARSIENARKASRGLERLRFRESDILTINPTSINCDILISSLTMHHFSDEEIVNWLAKFKQITTTSIIINDLHRHRLAYLLFKYLGPLLVKHKISRHDGLISIASGFKRADFKKYARAIGCSSDRLEWKWSFRYLWTIHIDACKN